MEKRSFSSLVSQVADIYKDIKYSEYQASKALSQGKIGEYRKYQAHIIYQKRKLYSIRQQIRSILDTQIIEVTYICNQVSKTNFFAGLTKLEVTQYLSTWAMVNEFELKILEIKELPTINPNSFL